MKEQRVDGLRPVFVVMAVFRPDPAHLAAQVASIARQTHPPECLVVVDADCASAERVRRLVATLSLETRIVTPPAPTPSHKSFEIGISAALETAPAGAVIALSDQDDVWHADKLEICLRALSETGAGLVHSDARVVDEHGRLTAPSLHRLERRRRNASLRDLLVENSVTGMTLVMGRDVAAAALPFPQQSALFFHHDLWLALVAGALGGIHLIDRPLVDYRQHGGNVVGAVTARERPPRLGSPAWKRHWAGRYSVAAYLAKCLYIRMGEIAAGEAERPDRRRIAGLAPYLSRGGIGPRFLVDAVRYAALGRPRDAIASLHFHAVRVGRMIWAARNAMGDGLLPSLAEFDRRAFAQAPGAQPSAARLVASGSASPAEAPSAQPWTLDRFADPRMAARFQVRVTDAPGRLVIAVPSLNPAEAFAGIATALDIGVGLAQAGVDVTFLATDLPIASATRSRDFILARAGQDAELPPDRVRLVCGVTETEVRFSHADRFLATAWWTAHLIDGILQHGFSFRRFYYLIQDFEPGFYPWGDESAGALNSYSLNHIPIFNTTLLRDHFAAEGLIRGAATPLAFQPSIDIGRYASLQRRPAAPRRLVVYGRPEVPRNLFGTAMLALDRFLGEMRLSPREVELLSVGLSHPDIRLSGGHRVTSWGKLPWDEYPGFLATVDVGLALMLSPHPSHLPIEMAAAGARVVTNGFAGKDLSRLSPAIQSVLPGVPSLAVALGKAWEAPAVAERDRHIDLSPLGVPLADVIAALARDVSSAPLKLAAKA